MPYEDGNSENGQNGSYEIFKAEGDVLYKQGEYKKAANSYSTALEMRVGDKNCLIARCQCHLQLGESEKALADADETLKEDKNYIKGLLQKAEAYYQMGQFEFALMFYHRGHRLRPEVQAFRLGIQKAEEAINNSVGDAAGIKLKNEGDLSFFYAEQQQEEEEDEEEEEEEIEKPKMATAQSLLSRLSSTRAPVTDPETLKNPYFTQQDDQLFGELTKLCMKQYEFETRKQKTKQKGPGYKPVAKKEDRKERRPRTGQKTDSKTTKQLLGELYADKEYLENMLKEAESHGRNTETNMAIRDLCIRGLDYLDTRTEFWQQQKPMYSRKRDKRLRESSGQRSDSGKTRDPTKWILKNLEDIDEAQVDGRYQDSLKQSKRVLKEVDKWNDNDVPNREEVVANLHSCIGNAYLELGDYDQALQHHTHDHEIATQKDIEDAKSRALDNLGRVYARMGKYDKAIDVWEEKLPLSKSPLESTWLYHEIGRCYLETNKYEKAKDFGERSRKAAEEADDDVWQLNASVLIAQSEVKLGDLQAALNSFEVSLDRAKLQGDKAAENAIKKAIDDVNSKIVRGVKGEAEEEEDKDKDRDDHGLVEVDKRETAVKVKSPKGSPRDPPKATQKEATKDSPKGSPKEAIQTSSQENDDHAVVEVANGESMVSVDSPKVPPRESPDENRKESPKDSLKEAIQPSSQETEPPAVVQVANGEASVSKNRPKGSARESPKAAPNEAPENLLKGSSGEHSQSSTNKKDDSTEMKASKDVSVHSSQNLKDSQNVSLEDTLEHPATISLEEEGVPSAPMQLAEDATLEQVDENENESGKLDKLKGSRDSLEVSTKESTKNSLEDTSHKPDQQNESDKGSLKGKDDDDDDDDDRKRRQQRRDSREDSRDERKAERASSPSSNKEDEDRRGKDDHRSDEEGERKDDEKEDAGSVKAAEEN